jgi:hypothetical protein
MTLDLGPIDDEDDDDRQDQLYLKYCFEGAASLPELASALRALAEDLDRRAGKGWRLGTPVDGGWVQLIWD